MVGIGRNAAPRGPERGDIFFVTFRDVGGNVLLGPHPAVVVQVSSMAGSSTTIVAPLTSRALSADLHPPYLVAVSARETGLDRDGWIKADQLFTFPVRELGPRVGRLSVAKLEELDRALRFVLDL